MHRRTDSPSPNQSANGGPDAGKPWPTREITPGQSALQQYKRQGYRYVNAMLRGQGGIEGFDDGTVGVGGAAGDQRTNRSLRDVQGEMKAMGDLLRKAPKYQGDTVYRGVTFDETTQAALNQHLADGKDWNDGGFVSTSRAASLKDWLRDSQFAGSRDAVVEIDLSQAKGPGRAHGGVDLESSEMADMVGGYAENEVLFHPGQRFRVVEVVSGSDKVKQRLGAKDSSLKASVYVKLVALPLTDSDVRGFERRVDGLKADSEPFVPAMPPKGPR